MKAALYCCVLSGLVLLTGCQNPQFDSLDTAKPQQTQLVRIEFFRTGGIFDEGDALFTMMNDTRQVLWFDGKDPDSPAYRLKTGAAAAGRSSAATSNASDGSQRIPLSPGQTRYFEIQTGKAAGLLSVGVTFFPSRTGTNGTTVWSSPTTVSPKARSLKLE